MVDIVKKIKNHIVNAKGKKVDSKIVVIESDDWGAIRTTNRENYNSFKSQFENFNNPYLKYDTLASTDDLSALFDVLKAYKDQKGNHPVITFNTVVANPDFEKIKASNFQEYHYEPFTETLKRYYPNENIFGLWEQGMKEGLIYPQFHGREHVNVPVWLEQLQSGNKELLKAYELGTWSTSKGKFSSDNIKLQASLDYKVEQPLLYQKEFIEDGLDLFEKIFGFRSLTMIANNFVLPPNLHPYIKKSGVTMLQGMKYQVQPYGLELKRRYIRRYFGQSDKEGLIFNVRNCVFEPSQTKNSYDDVGNCLKEISNAFFWKKPAVITSHRLNFIGSIDENNRTKNLELLNFLFTQIIKTWPDVEFISSGKLLGTEYNLSK